MVPETPTRLRLASFNLYKANYLDRPGPRGGTLRDDFARSEHLRGADILLLQEAIVGRRGRGEEPVDALRQLTALLPAHEVAYCTSFAGSPAGKERRWGVGIISRYPARFTSMWLPKPRWSPWQRAAMFAEIGAWIVGTLHLEVWPVGAAARRAQMEAILAHLEDAARGAVRPLVLAGDFNCERGGPHAVLRRAGFVPAAMEDGPTFALGPLRQRLDHIYVRGARVEAAGIDRAARGSDHWPVWATVNCNVSASNVDIQTVHGI